MVKESKDKDKEHREEMGLSILYSVFCIYNWIGNMRFDIVNAL